MPNFTRYFISNILYSQYKAVWRIPKLILKACTISLNALNYICILLLFLMSFESYMKYREC